MSDPDHAPGGWAIRDQPLGPRPFPVDTPTNPRTHRPKRRTGLLIGAAAAVLVIAAAGLTVALWPHAPAKPSRTEQATQVCEDQIRNQLKSPATAQFTNVSAADRDWDGIYLTGDVDAQNSFGAMLRTRWTCHAQLLSNGMWNATTHLE
jgi:hypothetical protein